MRDVRAFGTEEHMLHPSGLKPTVNCPWRGAMRYLYDLDSDEGGPAGDTGSACHRAIAAMHKGASTSQSLAAMQEHRSKYPSADLQEAAGMFLQYAADERNSGADVVLVEEPIRFSVQAADDDPTGEPIEIVGTLDQVRRVEGKLYLWDVKTSKKDPNDLLLHHVFQAAAYCVGATVKLGENVEPGGLILTRRYKNPSQVFHPFAWKLKDTGHILAAVRHVVASIRRGDLYHVPSAECQWCPAKTPTLCLPRLQETLSVLKRA